MENITGLIVAAGKGLRMQSYLPKQYMLLDKEPVIIHAIRALSQVNFITDIIVVVAEDQLDYTKALLAANMGLDKVRHIVAGGANRAASVWEGLKQVKTPYVAIHDGVRPFVSEALILRVAEAAIKNGAAIPALPITDTVKKVNQELFVSHTEDRSTLRVVQTPQIFLCENLIKCFVEALVEDSFDFTDEAGLLEYYGYTIALVLGEKTNLKITEPEDMQLAEYLLERKQMTMRVGIGYDVHCLVENRKLIIGGVEIPYKKGLFGHSDADVLLHAIMDALFGAAGLGDIGKHFPDTENAFAGISSLILLEKTKKLLDKSNLKVNNIDATIIAEAPKMANYLQEMCLNIATYLALSVEQVNVKATTTEKLGFVGRGDGIAAEAICSLVTK